MNTCKLIKILCSDGVSYFYMVVGIGTNRVFNSLWLAKEYISSMNYIYEYSEVFSSIV